MILILFNLPENLSSIMFSGNKHMYGSDVLAEGSKAEVLFPRNTDKSSRTVKLLQVNWGSVLDDTKFCISWDVTNAKKRKNSIYTPLRAAYSLIPFLWERQG